MIVLGIILVAVAVAVGLGVAVSSGDEVTLEVFGTNVGVTVAGVFFIGAALAATLLLGLWLVRTGLGRGHRRRKEVKELRQQVGATPTAPPQRPDRTDREGGAGDATPDRATAPLGDDAEGDTVSKAPEGGRQNS